MKKSTGKNIFIYIISFALVLVTLFVVVNKDKFLEWIKEITKELKQKEKVEVIFNISTHRKPGESGSAKVIINDEFSRYLDSDGQKRFSEHYPVGDTIHIHFEKPNYISQSDFSYVVKKEGNYLEKSIYFKKMAPPPPPKPSFVKNRFMFTAQNELTGVEIYLEDSLLGKTNEKGMFIWEQKTLADEKHSYKFIVRKKDLKLRTEPSKMVFETGNKNLTKNISIYGYIKYNPKVTLKFLNAVDESPLEDIEVRFSDSQKNYITNNLGVVEYTVNATGYKEKINLSIIDPEDLVIKEGFEPIIIDQKIPQNIEMKLLCEVTFIIKLGVEDLNQNPISGAKVELEGNIYHTDEQGKTKIPIKKLKEPYTLQISKPRYKTETKTITPTNRITDAGTIRLRGVSGIIVVQDSLSGDAIAYADILENSKQLTTTTENGRATIGVTLNVPMKIEVVPRNQQRYSRVKKTINFKQSNQVKIIELAPKPYEFNFNFSSAAGSPIQNVMVDYKTNQVRSDINGRASISTFTLTNNSNDEWFTISYRAYQEKFPVRVQSDQRTYQINKIIQSTVEATIASVPPGGEIKLYNRSGDLIEQGTGVLNVKIEPDIYRIVGVIGDREAEVEKQISHNGQRIEINLTDPIPLIIQKYSEREYQLVTEIYEDPTNKQRMSTDHQDYCEALNCVFKAYSHLDDQVSIQKSIQVASQMERDNCITHDPYFYYNLAGQYYNTGNWSEADEYYNKAFDWITYVKENEKAQFAADCYYFRIEARLQRAAQTGAFTDDAAKCLYLEETENLLNEFVNLALDKGLSTKNSENLDFRLGREKDNAGCH